MFQEAEEQAQTSLGEYWDVVRRRRWWILLPLFLCWGIVWSVGWLLPATYKSEALILVEQQKVPEQYVVPNVSVSLHERLQSMTQKILSRTRLQATIDRFHLYPNDGGLASRLQPSDPVDTMRRDIKIELVQAPGRNGESGELTAFKIQYSAGSPELAQQVNSELTSLFIDENVRSQQQLSESTTAFLGNELADARVKLEQQEAKVRAFKAQHLGELPSQLESNVQILSGLQAQLQGTEHAIDGAKQQKVYLESLLQQYESVQAGLSSGDTTVSSPEALDKQLQDLRQKLENARAVYTDHYPDVVALKDQVAKTEKLKKQIDDEIATSQETNEQTKEEEKASGGSMAEHHSATPTMMQIQSQLKVNQLEIENYRQHEKELMSQIATYQARLNLTPATEQELTDISRGYEESKTNYNSLLQKQMQSELATSLQKRQQGEQFRVIDPASYSTKPSAPNHLLVSLGGLAAGFAIGLGLTIVLELSDVRVRQEKDLEGLVPARVLVGIPHLRTSGEERRRAKLQFLQIGAATAMVLLMLAGNIYAFLKG